MNAIAVLSDVHSNIEALDAVLAEIDRRGIGTIYSLGDMVGYGSNPVEVVDRIRARVAVALRGNLEEALFDAEAPLGPVAADRLRANREQLRSRPEEPGSEERWRWLRERPVEHREGSRAFFHATPLDPVHHYLMPPDVERNPRVLAQVFARIEGVAFGGHTHQPGAFREGLGHATPAELGHRCEIGERRTLINVGSVGNPRDDDPRACFVVLHASHVEWVRVEYDDSRAWRPGPPGSWVG